MTSNSSSGSERSLSGECSVDVNSFDRGNEDECTQDAEYRQKEQKLDRVHTLERKSKSMPSDIERDIDIFDEKSKENGVDDVHFLSDREDDTAQRNATIWEPPEPENPEDELEGGVADVEDDDDDCCDGSNWTKSSLGEPESSEKRNINQENRRAMLQEADLKLKFVVSQLFKSAGSCMEEGENWLEIVPRLCWEAASLVKPAVDGKPVDPTDYFKVKCIATGSCNQSEVFKGLVFKKHAAHKHMATKFEHPRIMLVEGVLGESSGFSSLVSMDKDQDYVKPVLDIIEASKPDVMLVENSVSRDIQSSILKKGVTLVFDMKLHRLQRISRCIGSPILSLDSLSSQKLKHCDSFRIEKIVEEHNVVGEAEKKPTKTLMFLEGCPTRLGCTILLKGSHSERLKKVKEVVQYSVILAYHLILEASFLADRQTMVSTLFTKEATDVTLEKTSHAAENDKIPLSPPPGELASEAGDAPLSNGFSEQSIQIQGETDVGKAETWESDGDIAFSHEPYNPVIFTGFSSLSAKLSKYLGFVQNPESVPVLVDTDVSNLTNLDSITESAQVSVEKDDKNQPLLLDPGLPVNTNSDDGDRSQTENDTETALDSQSILVLVSKRNAFSGIMCDQSHFSHIKFYKHFDVPLERFLRDMFNQRSRCQTCEEFPDAHLYYYAHHNKQLTIEIKRIPGTKCLSGEAKGKIWMWSRCGKCKTKNGTQKSTKRVLISTAARSLSFGKFLELSFSQQPFLKRPSNCGHSFDRDFLHFFGLGSMVAMLSYSKVSSYTVSLPPMKLESSILIKAGWLEKEFQKVFTKGISLFEDTGSFLKRLRSQYTKSHLSHHSALKFLSTIEGLLKHERGLFEENIKISFDKAKTIDDVSHKLLRLNRIRWELLLQALIWNYRLQSLVLSDRLQSSTGERKINEQGLKTVSEAGMARYEANDKDSDTGGNGGMDVLLVEGREIPIFGASSGGNDQMDGSYVPEDNELQTLSSSGPDETSPVNSHFDTDLAVNIHSSNDKEADKSIPVTEDSLDDEVVASNGSHVLAWDEWFWQPFEELSSKRIVDVEKEYLLKFEYVNTFTQENLQTVNQIITEEGSRLRISLRDDDFIVSDYEDEISSLIACALAHLSSDENRIPLSRCIHGSLEGFLDKDQGSRQTVEREASRFSSESTHRLETLPPPEVLVTFGIIKSVGKPKYSVVCLYAEAFRELRKHCCSSELDYIASLSRCKPWDAKGGKSKSVFAKTLDDRFIVKEIKKTEYESFVTFAPEYFKYMRDSYELGNQTCLAKVLGIYQVTVRQPKGGKEIRHDLMVMENLSFGRNITRQYDLKGALHARFTASSANGADDVLLDQNFVNDMNKSPLYVSKTSKQNLQRAVYNDTSFLTSINVMDYSLLVGVDDENHELVCGIIDYLRQYTWDKQLETWVKSSLVVPKNVQPTVISPIDYKTRFRKFMKTHFLCVPDQWCNQGDS